MRRPTIEEVQEYIDERGYNLDAEQFHSYYEANGWHVGRKPMKDWKAAVRYWVARRRSDSRGRRVPVKGDPDFRGRF